MKKLLLLVTTISCMAACSFQDETGVTATPTKPVGRSARLSCTYKPGAITSPISGNGYQIAALMNVSWDKLQLSSPYVTIQLYGPYPNASLRYEKTVPNSGFYQIPDAPDGIPVGDYSIDVYTQDSPCSWSSVQFRYYYD